MRYLALLMLVVGCSTGADGQPMPAPAPAQPASCTKTVEGPTPVGGGNPTCTMSVVITISCAPGQSGHLVSVYGEAPSPTLYTASADAAYQCGVPVTLTRDGISCTSTVAADVGFWPPNAAGGPVEVCN